MVRPGKGKSTLARLTFGWTESKIPQREVIVMRMWASLLGGIVLGGAAVALSGGTAAAAESVEHTVRAGDNLHLIAGYYYRDPRQWRKVWQLNRAGIARPSSIVPGRTLRVEVTPGVTWDIPYEEFRARVRGN
jgi:hypothetical protein